MKEKLNCLLISPSIFYTGKENIWKEINSNFPPLGLADIAGYVRSKGFNTQIIDCNIFAKSVEEFEPYFYDNFVTKYDIDVFGLTSMTCNIKKAYEIAKICKKYYPNSKIVFGGVHATFMYEEVISQEIVDIVVIGEGELTFYDILSKKELKDIDGIVFKSKNGIQKNKLRERILDLNSMPMPAYDLLPISNYIPAKGSYKQLPAMSMMTSRGCPGRCTFCNKTLGNRIVFKSAETIFNEISYLKDEWGIKEVLFYDDTFTVFRENVMKLCELLIKNYINITWTCFARVDYIDNDMLKTMKEAGCHQIMYGIENIDDEVLKNINKKINLSQVRNAIKWTKENNIDCRLAFMVGNPGDNEEIIKKNINFIKEVEPDLLIVNITTPFPGTELFNWAKDKNLILSYDWDDYNFTKPIMKLENLSPDQIKQLHKMMYNSFYFRPSYIIRKIIKIRTWNDIIILFDGLKALINFTR